MSDPSPDLTSLSEIRHRYLEAADSDDRAGLSLLLRLHSWEALMELLDEHWPADIFPTLEDDPKRDDGARIVSLLRWVDRLRTAQKITCAHPATAEEAAQFLARMTDAAKHAPITYGVPNSSEFGPMAAIRAFIARGWFRR